MIRLWRCSSWSVLCHAMAHIWKWTQNIVLTILFSCWSVSIIDTYARIFNKKFELDEKNVCWSILNHRSNEGFSHAVAHIFQQVKWKVKRSQQRVCQTPSPTGDGSEVPMPRPWGHLGRAQCLMWGDWTQLDPQYQRKISHRGKIVRNF